MDDRIQAAFDLWRKRASADSDLIEELEAIREKPEEISDRFYRELEFGTGGLRGIIGAGCNRMNIYTVGKATEGYAGYLRKRYPAPSVAIACDSRIKSELFARAAAEVLAANGISVFIFPRLMPTPALSFAVRHLKCSGGIVITASHNPAKYNGYKVYGEDGCQITTQAAAEILEEIRRVEVFDGVKRLPFSQAAEEGKVSYIGEETVEAYLRAVSAEALFHGTAGKDLSIVYTPLNGTGLYCVKRVLEENGYGNVTVVEEQALPDGNFPTCPYPNPEAEEAMRLGIEYARRIGSDLVLATDPDCDRVGIAVRSGEGYVLLNANEMGALLFDYVCKRRTELGLMPSRPVCIKTIVTTDMAKKIARSYGVEVVDVLTGFKFIGEQIGLLEKKGEADRYIFGFEESCGYLSGTYVRDKDGVNASLLICEMSAYYREKKKSLLQVLDSLYDTYGYCLNTLRSYGFEGKQGFERMEGIMEELRAHPPETLAGRRVEGISDYSVSRTRFADGRTEAIHLPQSNVLKFMLAGDSSAVVRPSGTEPKLKLYLSVSAQNRREAAAAEEKLAGELMERAGI